MRPSASRSDRSGAEAAAVPETRPGTLATSVYERVRADILAGTLDPGAKLRIEGLTRRYGAGNTPVREALNRLLADGLVEREDQRGFSVAAASADDLVELTKTRCWLEGLALRESIAQGGEAWDERLVLAFHRLYRVPRSLREGAYETNPEWERRHVAYHKALLAACGSRWLALYCDQLRDLAYRYRQLAAARSFPRRDERAEHEAILNAALGRDAAAAPRLLAEHYWRTTELILSRREALAAPAPRRRTLRPRA
jgi:DNA-binding GntR family transcriptional regulator